MSALRIALLDQAGSGYANELAGALRDAGHEPELISAQTVGPVELVLERRGFMRGLSAVPAATRALLRGEFDAAHAFTVQDVLPALVWRRVAARPVVFTCTEPIDRGNIADSRLRLAALTRAFEETQAAIACDERVRACAERWLALSPPVLDSRDAAAYERLYRG